MVPNSEYVPRVYQLDALYVNRDVVRLARENLLENLQLLAPLHAAQIQPEIDFAIHSAIWIFSVLKRRSTFGQQLFMLSYDKNRLTLWRLCLKFLLNIFPGYMKAVEERRLSLGWLQQTVNWSFNATVLLSTLNFFRFLHKGCEPSLIDFLLGLETISMQRMQKRGIGYQYLNRELAWGGFMEMIGIVLHVINFHKLMRILKRVIVGESKQEKLNTRVYPKDANPQITICSYCQERPTIPHRMDCGHIYCYYCISANVIAVTEFSCILCGKD